MPFRHGSAHVFHHIKHALLRNACLAELRAADIAPSRHPQRFRKPNSVTNCVSLDGGPKEGVWPITLPSIRAGRRPAGPGLHNRQLQLGHPGSSLAGPIASKDPILLESCRQAVMYGERVARELHVKDLRIALAHHDRRRQARLIAFGLSSATPICAPLQNLKNCDSLSQGGQTESPTTEESL